MDSLGDRMKYYEEAARTKLPRRLPIILRVDGKAFSTYTKGCDKPFDLKLISALNKVGIALCKEIAGAQFAYLQSDEISILIHSYKRFETQPWFNNQVQKITSVAAGIASSVMTASSDEVFGKLKPAVFDARVFVLPEADVTNAFIWRQQDWARNSTQMLARSIFSHKQLHRKSVPQLRGMCIEAGKDWYDLPVDLRQGRCVIEESYTIENEEGTSTRKRWAVDNNIPLFKDNRDYIEKYLETKD